MGYFVCFEIILARLKYCSLNFQPHDSPVSFDPIARGAGVEGVGVTHGTLFYCELETHRGTSP